MEKNELKPSSNSNESVMDWFKRYIAVIKNTLPIFILVPTILGGLWQIIYLLSIGVSYIRFFSITQLISDGIILIILISIMALVPFVVYSLGKNLQRDIRNSNLKSPISIIFMVTILTLSFSALLYVTILGFQYLNSHFTDKISPSIEVLIIVFFLPVLSVYIISENRLKEAFRTYYNNKSFARNVIKTKFLNGINKISEFWHILDSIVVVFSFMTWILVSFRILFSFGQYYLPENLDNLSRINDVVKREYNLEPKDFTISYFNDTYIFIKYTNLTKEQVNELDKNHSRIPYNVIMLKTDSIFEIE